jgi:hypothetical protein
MKTFPDFSCERFCNEIQNRLDHEPDYLPERLKEYLQSAQGLIAIVPKLREHPQLEKLVPMKSLLSLCWFPAEDYAVSEENKSKYSITISRGNFDKFEIIERKVFAFDEVADEVYACITKPGNEPST